MESFFAGACTWQKILLSLQVWNLFAFSEQIMRAADCKPFVKKGLCSFLTVSYYGYLMSAPGGYLKGMDHMATVKEFRMSQERYDELKKELDYSKTTRADEIAELIKEARGFGDLSENSEYDEAKNEQGKLYSRIAELEEILLHAVIVDESEMDSDKISIGCRVVVTNLDNGKQLPEYTIVGSQEANVMERKVSEDSPFGKALMGRKAGDEITVEAPRGVIRYRVDTIER